MIFSVSLEKSLYYSSRVGFLLAMTCFCCSRSISETKFTICNTFATLLHNYCQQIKQEQKSCITLLYNTTNWQKPVSAIAVLLGLNHALNCLGRSLPTLYKSLFIY